MGRSKKKRQQDMYLLVVVFISLLCVMVCGKVAVDATVTSHMYRGLEANERATLEGFLRTASGRVDSAYICKERK